MCKHFACMHVCLCTLCMCAWCSQRPEDPGQITRSWDYRQLKVPCRCWGLSVSALHSVLFHGTGSTSVRPTSASRTAPLSFCELEGLSACLLADLSPGPINREMRHLISSLQNHNHQLKGDAQRYKRKLREVQAEIGKVSRGSFQREVLAQP